MLDRPPDDPDAKREKRRELRRARDRRRYKRELDGLQVALVEFSAKVANLLVRLNWLDNKDRDKVASVGDAITRLLREIADADAK